jgi:polysaccharide chain length determinant protein (PEP-CTERM system associated)
MRETIESITAEVHSAWRFRWAALLAAWLICLLGWALVFFIPGRYDTTTRVYVDTNTLLRPLLEGLAVSPNTINQVDVVRRALLGRPQLEKVIDGTDLYMRAPSERDRAELANELAQKIRITGDPQSRLYSITYGDQDPHVSYAVVKTLLNLFVGESVGEKRADAESAQKFLVRQLKEYEQRLTESEARLAAFKRKNVGYMPDDRGGYFERLQAEMQEVDRLKASLSLAQNKRTELRGKLLGTADAGANVTDAAVETSVDQRILEAKRSLDELLLRFTEAHPDAIALQETIKALEQQKQREIQALRSSSGLGSVAASSASPVLQNLQISLNGVELEIASLQSQLRDHQGRIEELRKNMNVLPEVEAELARLNRDYGTNRTQYEQLLQRLASARLTDQADRNDDLTFKIIEPPTLPLSPAAPKRLLLLAGVLIAGLGMGGGIAWLMSQLKPVFVSPRQLRDAFKDLPLLGSFHWIESSRASSLMRWVRGNLAYASLASMLIAAFVALVAAQENLEQLARKVLESGAGA